MVKVHGPMFSLDASGTIGKAATFSKWKGRNYVRERVVPANPKSGPQIGMRAMLSFISKQWASLSAAEKATWDTRAKATVISTFNAFTSYNQKRWRSFQGPSKDDPAAEASATPAAPTTTPTGGIRQIELSIADGAAVPDWGWFIYRSGTTGFTPAYSNCVAIVPRSGTPTVFIDTPLTAGTYYYRVGGFMDDGIKGTLEVERSAAAT
jgi:hypothetical protein